MFAEKKYETLIDLRFPVGQWQLRLFKAITKCVNRGPTQRRDRDQSIGQMLVAFDDIIFPCDEFAYVVLCWL